MGQETFIKQRCIKSSSRKVVNLILKKRLYNSNYNKLKKNIKKSILTTLKQRKCLTVLFGKGISNSSSASHLKLLSIITNGKSTKKIGVLRLWTITSKIDWNIYFLNGETDLINTTRRELTGKVFSLKKPLVKVDLMVSYITDSQKAKIKLNNWNSIFRICTSVSRMKRLRERCLLSSMNSLWTRELICSTVRPSRWEELNLTWKI